MSARQPLVGLLSDERERSIALGTAAEPPKTHSDFSRDVRALASAFTGDAGRRWLVETEDAYRIAVALLAAAAVGARIVLPPNLQPGTLRELAAGCDRIFADRDSSTALDPLRPERDEDERRAIAIDRDRPLVELFTSGSSGPGKRVTKALRHLEDEVVELEAMFTADRERPIAPDATVFATAPAHHLYGLLFRVLWPLASGRAFCGETFLLPDDLLARTASAPSAVVVSTPAHLRHLSRSPRAAAHRARIAAIFSSGGPLDSETALALERAFGHAPTEIFGSTETGGVALRRVTASDPSSDWRVFPSVTVELDPEDRRLRVTSPFVTAPDDDLPTPTDAGGATREAQSYVMGDRAEIVQGGFRLLGRSDRIVKVGEKTLSLPDIEQWLEAHELVEAAVTGTYAERSGSRLGAVVVLARAGRMLLAAEGRRAVQAVLAAHVTERWNRIAVPRRWRFAAALPIDARGKLAQQTVEAELARPVERPREPILLSEDRDGGDVVREVVVPRDLAYFDGHYDTFPLVPGVVQIHWVMLAVGALAGRPVSAQRMEAIKFRNVLRPADLVTMRLAVDDAFSRVTFSLGHGSRVFSSGRIALGS